MNRITWDHYDVWYRKRRCQVLIPKDTSQIWITQYSGMGQGGMDFDFWGNRKGLESVRDACTVLSEKDDIIVYLPCKNNSHLFLQDHWFYDYGCEGWKKGFKAGVFFWDDAIYQMERQRKQK